MGRIGGMGLVGRVGRVGPVGRVGGMGRVGLVGSIRAHVLRARQRLEEAGIPADEAALDSRLLAQHALGWDAAQLLAAGTDSAPEEFESKLATLVDRRARREPLAYITGTKEFWGLSFEVSRSVLIPRPETELLVEVALAHRSGAERRFADVCTGSGCVVVALAREFPSAQLVATDSSADALVVARGNAERHGVTPQIAFLQTDVLADAKGPFDLIVSNPPYVPEASRATLQPEVREFEPPAALFAGSDGLAVLSRLVDQSTTRLAPGGLLIFEFGIGQESAVRQLIADSAGLELIDLKRDLRQIPRAAVARRSS